jgi:Lrp/AsnC family leucine-responsive transcriptional regulator
VVEITLDRQGEEEQQAFEALVAGEAAVQQCYRSRGAGRAGGAVRDMPAYHALAHRLFASARAQRAQLFLHPPQQVRDGHPLGATAEAP